jgi:hypothetical protein
LFAFPPPPRWKADEVKDPDPEEEEGPGSRLIVASAKIPNGFGASPGNGSVVKFSLSIGLAVESLSFSAEDSPYPKTVPIEGNRLGCGRGRMGLLLLLLLSDPEPGVEFEFEDLGVSDCKYGS